MPVLALILKRLWDASTDLLPIILVIAFFQIFVLQQPLPQAGEVLLGALLNGPSRRLDMRFKLILASVKTE